MAASLFIDWERNRAAELFILENWRVPEVDMVALIELRDHQVRRRKDGSLMTDGRQMRMTSLLKAIYSFGEVCYAGQPQIANRMGSDCVKTVYRAMADAVLLGVLLEVRSPYKTDAYTIAWRRLFDWCVAFHITEGGVVLPTALQGVDRTPSPSDRTPSPSDRTPSPSDRTPSPPRCPTIPIKTHAETQNKPPCVSRDGFQKFSSSRGAGGWSKPITRVMLANPEQLDTLFSEAQIRGWIPRDPIPAIKLKLYTLAAYCVRRSATHLQGSQEFIEEAGAVFTAKLKAAMAGDAKAWLGSNEDEDTARRMIYDDGRCRDADLLAEEDRRVRLRDRDEQQAALRNWKPAG